MSATPIVHNKGTGAGGAKTNVNGKTFESKTSNESRLLSTGYTRETIPGSKGKYDFSISKDTPTGNIRYLTQGGLKTYFAHFHKKELCRSPDEAYLIRKGNTYTLKILEKKNQNVAGSVDTKLLAGPGFISEYKECLGEEFNVEYAFCLSSFLKTDYTADTPKARHLRKYNEKHGICVLFGEDEDYMLRLEEWIHS